jgi:hypothetical protein
MTERIASMSAGGGTGSFGRSQKPPAPPQRGRKPGEPEAKALSLSAALTRIEAAAREAGQDLQYCVESDDGGDMVVVKRHSDARVMRRMPAAEAIRLAGLLAGNSGSLFEGRL